MKLKLSISEATSTIETCIKANLKVLLVGAPGVGKTDIIRQAAKKLGYKLEFLHPAVSDPTDFKGLPVITPGGPEFQPFGDIKKLLTATEPTLAFIDDLGQSPISVQGALMQLLQGGQLNGVEISPFVTFIGATNDASHMAGVSGIIEPLKSRFSTILHVEPDVNSWTKWAIADGQPAELIQFLRWQPGMLCAFKATRELTNSASPRTIADAGRLWKAGLDDIRVLAGAVGEEFALMFLAFVDLVNDLPSIEEILSDPENATIPSKPDMVFATVAAVCRHAVQENFQSIITYLGRLPRKELRVFAVLDITRMKPELRDCKAYTQWALDNAESLLSAQ